ncbi:MAG: ATP-binding protein [Halobacteriales archaeon]
MSHLLADPRVVLVVGGSAPDRDDVRAALAGGVAADAVTVDDLDALRSSLAARDDVGCVVAVDPDESAFAEVHETVRAVDDDLPVVAYAAAEGVAAAVATRAACRYVPRSAADALEPAVADALATFADRRQERADSSILQTLLDEGQLTIFAKDTDGRFLRMADVPYTPDPEEGIGRTDPEVFDDDPETTWEAYEDDLRVAETGETIRDKVEHYTGQGGDHWSEVTKLPWDMDGERQGIVGYALDVTDREHARRQLDEQRRRFDQFASYVSHDLRTPLQVIVASLDLARAGSDDALDRIDRATDRIEEIIDDLSSLSKGDRSGVALSEEVLDVLDVGVPTTDLASLVERVWGVQATEGATLDLAVPDGTEVIADAETLRPVVENLLKNALDHAGPGVTVRVGVVERGFYVADDGPGIPEGDREAVFEAGYTTAEDGSGTGLEIVAETADQEDWTVAVTESDGGGARFEIRDCAVVVPADVSPGDALALTDSADVGDVSRAGEARQGADDGDWTVVGNGRDIWRDIDEFHIAYGEATGPVRIEGRLAEFDGDHEYSKAGLMVRDGLDEDAALGFVGVTGAHGTELLWREATGADASSEQLEEPYDAFPWYRIDAVDGTVTLWWSTDGREWQALDQRTVALADPVVVGLAVCSHGSETTSEASFENVSVTELERE